MEGRRDRAGWGWHCGDRGTRAWGVGAVHKLSLCGTDPSETGTLRPPHSKSGHGDTDHPVLSQVTPTSPLMLPQIPVPPLMSPPSYPYNPGHLTHRLHWHLREPCSPPVPTSLPIPRAQGPCPGCSSHRSSATFPAIPVSPAMWTGCDSLLWPLLPWVVALQMKRKKARSHLVPTCRSPLVRAGWGPFGSWG